MARKKRKADPAQSVAAAATATNHQQELSSSELKPRYVHITDDRPKRTTKLAAAEAAAAEEEDGDDFTKLIELLNREQLVALLRVAAEASPAAMAAVRRAAESDPASRKLFVHGLDKRSGAQDLRSAFSRFGEVEDCRVITDRQSGNNCKGYGFVLFRTRGAALRALRHPRIQISGRPAFCKLAAFGPAPPSSQSQNPPSSSANASSVTSNDAPASSSSSQLDNVQRKIFIGNVHADVDVDRLHEYFSQFGEIEEGPLMGFDKSTGKPTGFALFVYKSMESARRALEEPMQNFDGKVLNVQATDGITNSTPGSNSNANSSATAASAQMNEPSISAINPYDPSTYGATAVHGMGFAHQAAMPGMGAHQQAFAQPNIAMLAMMAAVMQNPAMLAALNPAFAAMGAGGQHTGIPGFGAQGFGTQGPSPGGGSMASPAPLPGGGSTTAPWPSPGGGSTGAPMPGEASTTMPGPLPVGGSTTAPGPCLGGGFAAVGIDFPTAAGLQKFAAYQGGPPGFQGTPGFPTSAGFQVGQADSQTGTTAAAAGATGYQAGAAGQGQVPSSQTGFQGAY